jgi:hypothetical protein
MRIGRLIGVLFFLLFAAAILSTGCGSTGGSPGEDSGNGSPTTDADDTTGAHDTTGADSTFSFIVFGDLNGGGCARNSRVQRVVERMALEQDIAFYVQTGDIIDGAVQSDGSAVCFGGDPVDLNAADDCGDGIDNGNMARMLAPIKDRQPAAGLVSAYYPVIGNHDDNRGSGWYPDPCGQGFCRFLAPLTPADFINHDYNGDMCSVDQDTSNFSGDFYYSFAYKNSYFIVLRENNDYYGMMSCNGRADCNAYCSDPDNPDRDRYCYNVAQFDWLRGQLEYAGGRYDHIFVFSHAVLLGSGDHQNTDSAPQLRALLEGYGVKIHFNGHNHSYLRTYAVKGENRDDAGTVYITVGGAGGASGEGVDGGFSLAAASAGDWASYGSENYNEQMATYLKITIAGNAVSGRVFSLADAVSPVDQFSLSGSTGGGDAGQDPSSAPRIAGCALFPDDNFWNTRVDTLPVHPSSAAYIVSIGAATPLHPDFGTQWNGTDIGIPYDVVPADQPLVPITFDYWDESDMGSAACSPADNATGCYPIPTNPSIEGGSDRHILLLQQGSCTLYEIYSAEYNAGRWSGGSGAIWHLDQNEVRPSGWTSADASGLAILPGLVRYDEVMGSGEINHAIRITLDTIQRGYIRPASHTDGTGGTDSSLPPMGLRLRLKADYDISGFSAPIRKILRAMKSYGIVVADTGSDMYVSGQHHDDWDDDLLRELSRVTAGDFEALYTGDVIPY